MQISGTATELCPPPYLVALSSQNYSQNQLTKETYYDGAGNTTDNITKTITYTYDTAGNILSETKTVGTTTTTKNYTYSEGNWKDLLTQVGNTTISYDGGNPTNWYNGSKTYTGLTWQQGRQLAGLTVGETSVSYEYDADGIRTKMVAGDVTYEFVTQGGKLMRETATNSSAVYVMDFIYDNAGRPFAVKFSKNGGRSFTTFYYVLNLQGDVVAITKADGTVVAKYTYDAWGNLTSLINANGTEIVNRTTGTAIAFWNPLTYRGYIRDRETGFYYLQSRYYDPANHRFINADSYASTESTDAVACNMFAYCNNNPVVRVDCGGQFWETVFDVISLGASIVEVCVNPTDPWAWAGLAGDVIDLIPFVTGVGEATRAVKTTVKVVDNATDVVDTAKTIYKTADAASDIRKATGSYEILYKSGKNYIGKGGFNRAITSATRNATKYGDEVTSIMWKSAPNGRSAFIDEYLMQKGFGGVLSSNRDLLTYNKIWSPGRRYFSDY